MEPTQTQGSTPAVYTPPSIIAEVAVLLGQPIPEAEEDLEIHLVALDALRYPVAVATSDAMQLLAQKKKQLLWPKDMPNMKVTELDRQTHLSADVAPIERDYQLLTRIEALLQERINLCIFLMRD